MKVNLISKINFTAIRPKMINEEAAIKQNKSPYSIVEIDVENENDMEALKNVTEEWPNAMYVENIYYFAQDKRDNVSETENEKFYALTSQKENLENLDASKIVALADVTEEGESEIKIHYIERKSNPRMNSILGIQQYPDSGTNPNYKQTGGILLESLKGIYNKITLNAAPSKTLENYYEKHGFRKKNSTEHTYTWERFA